MSTGGFDKHLFELPREQVLVASDLLYVEKAADQRSVHVQFGDLLSQVPDAGVVKIDDLLDVDTATVTPVSGDILEWDGVNWVVKTPVVVSASRIEDTSGDTFVDTEAAGDLEKILFSANGTTIGVFASTGLGIGTKTPLATALLHIVATGASNALVVIDTSGFVGFGTPTPVTSVHVLSPVGSSSTFTMESEVDRQASFAFLKTGGQSYSLRVRANNTNLEISDGTSGLVPFRLESGARSDSLRINSAGNVGIAGITGPAKALHVGGNFAEAGIRLGGTGTETGDVLVTDQANVNSPDISAGDGSILMQVISGAGALFIRVNGVWQKVTAA